MTPVTISLLTNIFCSFPGLVNTILSWKAFIPLSRLTYAVYLVHPLVLWFFFATTQVPTDFTITFYVSKSILRVDAVVLL